MDNIDIHMKVPVVVLVSLHDLERLGRAVAHKVEQTGGTVEDATREVLQYALYSGILAQTPTDQGA